MTRPTPRIALADISVQPTIASPFLVALARESLCVIARGSGATQRRVLFDLMMTRGLKVELPRGVDAS